MSDITIAVALATAVAALTAVIYRIVRPGCSQCKHGVGKRSDHDYCYLYYDGNRWYIKDVRGIVDTITLDRCPGCGRLLPKPKAIRQPPEKSAPQRRKQKSRRGK